MVMKPRVYFPATPPFGTELCRMARRKRRTCQDQRRLETSEQGRQVDRPRDVGMIAESEERP